MTEKRVKKLELGGETSYLGFRVLEVWKKQKKKQDSWYKIFESNAPFFLSIFKRTSHLTHLESTHFLQTHLHI